MEVRGMIDGWLSALSAWAGTMLLVVSCASPARAEVIDFEGLLSTANSFFNGGPNSNTDGFTIGSAYFPNEYSSDFGGYWSGWAYSNVVDSTNGSYTNQYAAYPGSGFQSSSYGVAYGNTYINFVTPSNLQSMAIANTTYAALTMRDGDRFSKKFGGPTGLDPDYYRLRITGYTGENATGSSTSFIDHYLADFRFPDSQLDYIQADWRTIDLSGLGLIRSIGLEIDSSDRGQFGIYTPVYFAMDRLAFQISPIPEPGSLALTCIVVVAGLSRRCLRRHHASQKMGPHDTSVCQ
jgi:hypothetical protein